jgi:hypothetical protein
MIFAASIKRDDVFHRHDCLVAKVDMLIPLCDAPESRLKERAGVQARLARAGVKQVAG